MSKMPVVPDLPSLISSLENKFGSGGFPNWISYLRFPRYRNLVDGARLDLRFPVVALVGPNGSGKTSVLHALYGSVRDRTIGNFWFSTVLDPIEEGEGKRNAVVCGYYIPTLNMSVETVKTRIRKPEDPDYWEPSRPLTSFGMQKMGKMTPAQKPFRSATRWNAVDKGVAYIDFRRMVTAFDRCFWLGGDLEPAALAERKELIRRRAPHLALAIKDKLQSRSYFGKERIITNRELTPQELAFASAILGRQYLRATLVDHSFYGSRGYSVKFERTAGVYSEAFAGSGETAVIHLVQTILSTNPGSLILLDEPEVSLHPGAQERLLAFVMSESLKHGHQVVISTHSPALVDRLPPHAIQVVQEAEGGKFGISVTSSVSAAFNVLGHVGSAATVVVVEDEFSGELLKAAFRKLGVPLGQPASPRIVLAPGGSSSMLRNMLPSEFVHRRNTYFILDGDIFKGHDLPESETIEGLSLDALEKTGKTCFGMSLVLFGKGGDDPNAEKLQLARLRQFYEYARSHVGFLPGRVPEALLWSSYKKDDSGDLSSMEVKALVTQETMRRLGRGKSESVSAAEIGTVSTSILSEVLSSGEPSWWTEILQLAKVIAEGKPLREHVSFESGEDGTRINAV